MGKSSLRSWRQLALEQLDEQDGEADQSNGRVNGSTFSKGTAGLIGKSEMLVYTKFGLIPVCDFKDNFYSI